MNKCLFCDENFYIDKLIFENEYWRSVRNVFPQDIAKYNK